MNNEIQEWDYEMISSFGTNQKWLISNLKLMDSQGWELVSTQFYLFGLFGVKFIFKRPKN